MVEQLIVQEVIKTKNVGFCSQKSLSHVIMGMNVDFALNQLHNTNKFEVVATKDGFFIQGLKKLNFYSSEEAD
jgi:hypothetical protein